MNFFHQNSFLKKMVLLHGFVFYISRIEYTITIANDSGGSTATNIVVTDRLNAEISGGRLAFNPNTYAPGQGIRVTAPNINGGATLNLTDADAGDFNVTGANTVTVSGIALNAGQSATVKFG
jgi:uncharacterized repeat protein (TIGR01451 family)